MSQDKIIIQFFLKSNQMLIIDGENMIH